MSWKDRLKFRRGGLLENTVMLYILQFSNMAMGLLTQGYQTRVLGLDRVGLLGAAQYTTGFFHIFIDFGFIFSATAKISRNREDKGYLGKILSCVILCKSTFMVISFLILFLFITPSVEDPVQVMVYAIYLFSECTYSLLPDFMYRGMEQMKTITVRAVSIKFFATLMIFFFVHRPEDYYMVPLFPALGNIGAILVVYWHLFHKMGVRFGRVSPKMVWGELRDSSQFFFSQVASTVNSNLNGILLNSVQGPSVTGLYTNADKVIAAARSGISPIADSLYPHMMMHRDFRLIKKAMTLVYPVILLGCGVVFAFAEPLLVLWLGPEGSQVVRPLRMLIPVVVFTFPNYILSYPTLGAMGLAKYANISTLFGTLVYLLGVLLMWSLWGISLDGLCLLTVVTEASILAFRLVIIFKNRRLMRERPRPSHNAPL